MATANKIPPTTRSPPGFPGERSRRFLALLAFVVRSPRKFGKFFDRGLPDIHERQDVLNVPADFPRFEPKKFPLKKTIQRE
jgi:hypothetical protein